MEVLTHDKCTARLKSVPFLREEGEGGGGEEKKRASVSSIACFTIKKLRSKGTVFVFVSCECYFTWRTSEVNVSPASLGAS